MTDSLTGVKCRATSVAKRRKCKYRWKTDYKYKKKNIPIWLEDSFKAKDTVKSTRGKETLTRLHRTNKFANDKRMG